MKGMMPKSPNDPAECSAEKEEMITSIFDQEIGMGSKCVGCSGLCVWADEVSQPDYPSSHSFLEEFIFSKPLTPPMSPKYNTLRSLNTY